MYHRYKNGNRTEFAGRSNSCTGWNIHGQDEELEQF